MKNINFFKIVLIFSFFTCITSCDKIEKPYIEEGNYCGNDTLSITIRKILLEDYTAHRCGNCPRAAGKVAELKTIYCDHIIPIAVHIGYFASPLPPKYTYDFRTEAGEELNNYFEIENNGLPTGMVNRIELNGKNILDYQSEWATAIQLILETPPEIDITIENEYTPATRELSTKVKAEFLKDMNKTLKLTVYLVEDSIIACQKDYQASPEDVESYVHRHVLRKAINSTWGDEILSGNISATETIEKTYYFTLDTLWADNHCSVIAFVYDDDTKEIIQAEEEQIKN